MTNDFYQKIYALVGKIPKGKVATYGQIAALAGAPRSARVVGWVLHILTEPQAKKVPWQRVINKEGIISTTCEDHPRDLQKMLLEGDGVEVKEKNGCLWVDLEKYLWKP
ncbi:MAG: MGMT family protein [Patescibacteria group bacterium]|jgi:methylated-DNA-protein-cysteine methyltransferase-like protein